MALQRLLGTVNVIMVNRKTLSLTSLLFCQGNQGHVNLQAGLQKYITTAARYWLRHWCDVNSNALIVRQSQSLYRLLFREIGQQMA